MMGCARSSPPVLERGRERQAVCRVPAATGIVLVGARQDLEGSLPAKISAILSDDRRPSHPRSYG